MRRQRTHEELRAIQVRSCELEASERAVLLHQEAVCAP